MRIDAQGTGCSSPNGLWWFNVRFPSKHVPPSRSSTAHGNSRTGIPCIRVGAFGIRNAHQRLVVIVIPAVTHIDGLLGISGVGESRDGESWDRASWGVRRERSGVGEPNDGSQRPLVVVDSGDDIRTIATDLPRQERAGEFVKRSPEALALSIGLAGVCWRPALFQSKNVRPEGGFDFACGSGVTNLPGPEEVVLRIRSQLGNTPQRTEDRGLTCKASMLDIMNCFKLSLVVWSHLSQSFQTEQLPTRVVNPGKVPSKRVPSPTAVKYKPQSLMALLSKASATHH